MRFQLITLIRTERLSADRKKQTGKKGKRKRHEENSTQNCKKRRIKMAINEIKHGKKEINRKMTVKSKGMA